MLNYLTQKERLMISQVAADLELGNHLLSPRSREYREFMTEVCQVLDAVEKTERQFQICMEYYEQFYGGNDRED